jgi:glutamate synthase domain-containing protein 1
MPPFCEEIDMTKYINDDYVNMWAQRMLMDLRSRGYVDAEIQKHYTCGTLEGDDLMTIQVSIDRGKKRPPMGFIEWLKKDNHKNFSAVGLISAIVGLKVAFWIWYFKSIGII